MFRVVRVKHDQTSYERVCPAMTLCNIYFISLSQAFRPTADWGPAVPKFRTGIYADVDNDKNGKANMGFDSPPDYNHI